MVASSQIAFCVMGLGCGLVCAQAAVGSTKNVSVQAAAKASRTTHCKSFKKITEIPICNSQRLRSIARLSPLDGPSVLDCYRCKPQPTDNPKNTHHIRINSTSGNVQKSRLPERLVKCLEIFVDPARVMCHQIISQLRKRRHLTCCAGFYLPFRIALCQVVALALLLIFHDNFYLFRTTIELVRILACL